MGIQPTDFNPEQLTLQGAQDELNAQSVRLPRHASRGVRTEWEQHFPWEGQRLLEQLQTLPTPDQPVRVLAYVSESPEIRSFLKAAITSTLQARGVPCSAQVRSAYKSAYFWVTEELRPIWRRAQADRLTLTYPQLSNESPGRFLQELYPLAAVLEREGLHGEYQPAHTPHRTYQAILWQGDREVWRGECFVPLQSRVSPDGRNVLGPTGWLSVQSGTRQLYDERIATDGELFWDWYCATVIPRVLQLSDERADGLVFQNLSVSAHLSEPDFPLEVLEERVSMTEALTEEVYFGTLDALKRHTQTPTAARTLTPGRIVPIVHNTPGQEGRVRVVLTEWSERPLEIQEPPRLDSSLLDEPLTLLDRPCPPTHIWATARQLANQHGLDWHIPAASVDGRPVPTVIRSGQVTPDGIIVTAGQHANETTGPVAALKFIAALAASEVNFAVLPLENPDGAHLHRTLIQLAPDHMHHAARYTSLGDDLEARVRQGQPRWEARARVWAQQEVHATLHLNLHGYPAHEWVRPYSGYAPHGFESWALPAGFLTIIWYWPGHQAQARALAEVIAGQLKEQPDIARHAERASHISSTHLLQPHYELIHGLPFILSEQPAALCPLTVITEAPDETIYGELFRMFVKAHLTVCQAALDYHTQP
ncbi:M14 family zinc carboxypeptidase [Deinococcus peraridilitoris]|uniref:Zinc carboxypeptidase n=1 Tax=Deinococcus peraridilitoris (strain DSM 19664 / LMG 22246 / CIP 109416 / KR-200) TaxID=937777 RepID=L0A654_DEIPD|nr:M14 family zinc carboxypeptidase [Deinococcus peraridilitoris]AFZ69368.1 Zinc carboxypeptidase [Deinococcus peraridilitoris DSM 19664]